MSKTIRSKTEPIKRIINEGLDISWALTPKRYSIDNIKNKSEARTKLPKLKQVEN